MDVSSSVANCISFYIKKCEWLTCAIPMAPPGKYGLKYCPSLKVIPAGASQYPVSKEKT